MSKTMTLKPRVSEKAYASSEKANTYVFMVPRSANKMTVAEAVQSQFSVTVEEVNIMNSKGKIKQSYRKGSRPILGQRSDVKKAYVRIKQGETIPVFAAPEDTPKADKKNAKKEQK